MDSSFWGRLTEGIRELGGDIGNWIPKILGALFILIVGWIIARFIRRIVRRLLDNDAVEGVLDKIGVGGALREAGYTAAGLVSTVVYFFLLLVVFLFAAEALEVQAFVDLLERLIGFLPQVAVAVVIVIAAAWVGKVASDIARPWAESQNLSWLALTIQVGFLVFGVITALDLLGIGLFTNTVLMFVLGTAGAILAIAFGVGGIETARKWWAKYLTPSGGGGGGGH